MLPPDISVVICTHNPVLTVLQATLNALRAQNLAPNRWELLVIDNASRSEALTSTLLDWHPIGRLVRETELGLTPARLRGLRESRGALIVLVDDDNRLAPDYLSRTLELAHQAPRTGAWGGRILPEFAVAPQPWQQEFLPMLALRDLGPAPRTTPPPAEGSPPNFTEAAPLGAGMVLRRAAFQAYADALAEGSPIRRRLDRRGCSLTSGGDNDLVMTLMRAGWAVAYEPSLQLTHFIPAARLETAYLGRLRRAIFRSWVAVRALHGLPTSPPVARWRVPLLQAAAWVHWRAWRGGSAWVHWMGQCGDYEGRADLHA